MYQLITMSQNPLWDKSTSSVQNRLRQPKQAVSETASVPAVPSVPPVQPYEENYDIVLATSNLKVDAPEWYPPNHKIAAQQETINYFPTNVHITIADSRIQSRLHKFKSSNNPQPQPHVMYNFNEHDNSNLNEWQKYSRYVNSYSKEDITGSPDVIRLRQIIFSLISYPGQFDDLLGVFMETICPYFDDILALSEIAKLLVTEAINCSSFRYNSARLCWYVEQQCPAFRAELHLRCQKELADNPNKHNVVLFIAELYTQLPHATLYGTLLIDCLKQLLSAGDNDNVKCVCQALKLTGYSLDQYSKHSLDEVFLQLTAMRNFVNGSALTLLNSVVNLRQSNWGRSPNETPNNDLNSEPEFDIDIEENAILYETTGGQSLTNEEQEFLVAHAINDDYLIDTEDPDELCDPEPEMDEEIQAAFREFVKLNKR